jgi:hypothetical protein
MRQSINNTVSKNSFVQTTTTKNRWYFKFDIDLETVLSVSIHSLNYTFGALLKHHTIDIVICYCAPHISSVGSIDDRDSTSVAKMSVGS